MKKITIISALVAASLLLGACDKTKAADNGQGERYAAPFGLTWGMTEEALVPRLGSQSETDNSEYVCPLTKVTSKTFSGGLNEAGSTNSASYHSTDSRISAGWSVLVIFIPQMMKRHIRHC